MFIQHNYPPSANKNQEGMFIQHNYPASVYKHWVKVCSLNTIIHPLWTSIEWRYLHSTQLSTLCKQASSEGMFIQHNYLPSVNKHRVKVCSFNTIIHPLQTSIEWRYVNSVQLSTLCKQASSEGMFIQHNYPPSANKHWVKVSSFNTIIHPL